MYRPTSEMVANVDWETPVFKLTYHLHSNGGKRDSLLHYLLERHGRTYQPSSPATASEAGVPMKFASLKVSTENLGDHIQIIASQRLSSKLGYTVSFYINRDHEITSAPTLDAEEGPVGIIVNGWFKTNSQKWPPHPKL